MIDGHINGSAVGNISHIDHIGRVLDILLFPLIGVIIASRRALLRVLHVEDAVADLHELDPQTFLCAVIAHDFLGHPDILGFCPDDPPHAIPDALVEADRHGVPFVLHHLPDLFRMPGYDGA